MSEPSAHALVAHVLRRLTFGPSEAHISKFVKDTADPKSAARAAIDWSLAAPPRPLNPDKVTDDGWETSLRGWLDNMRSPDAGLHEKMTWLWHSHFATSSEKVGNVSLLLGQQRLFREHALGNFATLLRAILSDPAMLLYLDASGSSVESPNENLSRELMELFTLGRGNYSEADVKAGALALAGWEVNYETGEVTKNLESSLGGEVVYLGKRGRLGVDEVVDTILRQPACAEHIAGKIHAYLTGVNPSKQRLAELGSIFRDSGYEIRPLIESIVGHESFLSTRMNRPKYAIEWFVAAGMALGQPREGEEGDLNPWTLEQLDQLPFKPPNVAGWPPGPKWLSASQQLTRSAYVWGVSWWMRPIEGTDLVGATLRRCGMHEVSAATRQALHGAALATAGSADSLSVSRRLLTSALSSPEFALA